MKLGELEELMDTSQRGEPTALIPFRVERSEFTAQLNFATPYWPIAQNISLLYSGLLNRMRDFGVTSQGIRADAADGTLGAFNVNFWMLQFAVSVRIRLDYLELNAPNFAVDADQLERALLALDQSLRNGQQDLSYSSYVVTFGMHGRLEGIEAKQFVSRFANDVPEGLGKPVGSGTVFYYEGPPPATLLTVTIDLSGVVAGGISVRVHSVFDESMKPELLRSTCERQLETGIRALGLMV